MTPKDKMPPSIHGANTGKQAKRGGNKLTPAALSRIKLLIAAGAVAGTLAGWGLLNQQESATTAQAGSDASQVVNTTAADESPTAPVEAAAGAQLFEQATQPAVLTDTATPSDTATATATAGSAVIATPQGIKNTAASSPTPTSIPSATMPATATATSVPANTPTDVLTATRVPVKTATAVVAAPTPKPVTKTKSSK